MCVDFKEQYQQQELHGNWPTIGLQKGSLQTSKSSIRAHLQQPAIIRPNKPIHMRKRHWRGACAAKCSSNLYIVIGLAWLWLYKWRMLKCACERTELNPMNQHRQVSHDGASYHSCTHRYHKYKYNRLRMRKGKWVIMTEQENENKAEVQG